MEQYIKNNVSDITYLSELTPHPAYGMQALQVNFTASAVIIPKAGCGVKFALITYSSRSLGIRKLCAH